MIKVLIVDDHQLVRTGLIGLLEQEPGIQVIGESASGEEAVRAVDELNPQVILMDLQMPGIGGLEASKRCLRIAPDVKIIVLSMLEAQPFPKTMCEVGVRGYVSKNAASSELAAAIRRVMAGQRYVSNELAQLLALDPVDAEISPFELLSGREMQITLMVIRGMSAQEIGKKLALSPKTVNSYRYRVFEKLDLKNDVELTKLALKHDLLTEEVA